jgi:hypothetical protein
MVARSSLQSDRSFQDLSLVAIRNWLFDMAHELSISQQSRLRALIAGRAHPDRIDGFLTQCGIPESELDDFYIGLNMRRSHLLDRYKMKRNVRVIGALVICTSISIPVISAGQTTILVSLGLLVYGVALAITGSLTVFRP